MQSIFPTAVTIFCKMFAVLPINSELQYVPYSLIYSLIMLSINCLHLYYLPVSVLHIERELGNSEENLTSNHVVKILYSAVVYVTSLISRLNCIFTIRRHLGRFQESIISADSHISPTEKDFRLHRKFCTVILVLILTLTIPINVVRLRMFYNVANNYETVLLFCDMYFQNLSSTFAEVQFSVLAFALYIRLKVINRHLSRMLKASDKTFRQRYNNTRMRAIHAVPLSLLNVVGRNNNVSTIDVISEDEIGKVEDTVELENEFCCSIRTLFKVYKQLFRAYESVQVSYAFQLLASSCCLWLMTLSDLYMELFGFIGGNSAKPSFGTYIWCAQYITRFIMMAETSQRVINEVSMH